MPNPFQMMKRVASRFKLSTVPGAVALSYRGKAIAFAGIPMEEIFHPQGFFRTKFVDWMRSGQDAHEEEVWKMITRSHLAPGRAEADIVGLHHSGASAAMRKKMTGFGSGWQGLDPGFTIEHQKMGEREFLGVLKKGQEEVGYMGYSIRPGGVLEQGPMQIFDSFKGQGHGKGLLTEIMREGRKKGAITFRSDPAGLSEDMIHTFESGQRAGIMQEFEEGGGRAFKANLFNLDRVGQAVMKSGEGAAIAKAGTAEVPAVLRATSRIIKSAL